jgi:hypothetical protein
VQIGGKKLRQRAHYWAFFDNFYDNNSSEPFHVLSIIGQFMCDSKVGTFSVAPGYNCVDRVMYLILANDYGEMVVASR